MGNLELDTTRIARRHIRPHIKAEQEQLRAPDQDLRRFFFGLTLIAFTLCVAIDVAFIIMAWR